MPSPAPCSASRKAALVSYVGPQPHTSGGKMGMMGSAPATGKEAPRSSDGSRITSSALCPAMRRPPPISKRAAVTAPLTRVCPSLISVLEVDGFVVAIEFERGRTLFLGTEAGILGAAEGELVRSEERR